MGLIKPRSRVRPPPRIFFLLHPLRRDFPASARCRVPVRRQLPVVFLPVVPGVNGVVDGHVARPRPARGRADEAPRKGGVGDRRLVAKMHEDEVCPHLVVARRARGDGRVVSHQRPQDAQVAQRARRPPCDVKPGVRKLGHARVFGHVQQVAVRRHRVDDRRQGPKGHGVRVQEAHELAGRHASENVVRKRDLRRDALHEFGDAPARPLARRREHRLEKALRVAVRRALRPLRERRAERVEHGPLQRVRRHLHENDDDPRRVREIARDGTADDVRGPVRPRVSIRPLELARAHRGPVPGEARRRGVVSLGHGRRHDGAHACGVRTMVVLGREQGEVQQQRERRGAPAPHPAAPVVVGPALFVRAPVFLDCTGTVPQYRRKGIH